MAERLTPRTLDLEVRGSSLARRVVSLDQELYSTLSLFIQVYKWVLATYCEGARGRGGEGARGRGGRGSIPAMDQHPVQGEVAILLGMLHATGIGISAPPLSFYVCLGENIQ